MGEWSVAQLEGPSLLVHPSVGGVHRISGTGGRGPQLGYGGVFMISTCCHGNHEHSKHSFATRTISLIIKESVKKKCHFCHRAGSNSVGPVQNGTGPVQKEIWASSFFGEFRALQIHQKLTPNTNFSRSYGRYDRSRAVLDLGPISSPNFRTKFRNSYVGLTGPTVGPRTVTATPKLCWTKFRHSY